MALCCKQCGEKHSRAEIELWDGYCFQCYINKDKLINQGKIMKIWKDDTPLDILEYFYEQTRMVSLIATNGKRDDLEPDEIRKIMFRKLKVIE